MYIGFFLINIFYQNFHRYFLIYPNISKKKKSNYYVFIKTNIFILNIFYYWEILNEISLLSSILLFH